MTETASQALTETATSAGQGWRRLPDFGLIAVILLSLFAAIPLLQNPGLPNGSDVLYHVYRVAEMDRSWQHGLFLPRWAEGLYYGYGSPLWHFYAPLTYHITSILIRLFDLSALEALRWLLMGTFFGMGTGMYLFTKNRVNKLAGIIAALLYLYSPYLIYTEPYARGTYPELLAFALFPFVLWRFSIVIQSERSRQAVLAAVLLFLLIIAHNLMALTLSLVLALWLLWNTVADLVAQGRQAVLRPYGLAWAAFAAGIGLAAYFWLPILFESDSVNLQNLTGVALLDYRNFFLSIVDMIGLMPLADAGAINGLENVYRVGVIQWVLAAFGFIWTGVLIVQAVQAGRRDDPVLRQGVFFGLLALLLIVLMTPVSQFLWDGLRPLTYLQFPWRLLGPLALCLAFVGGMNALWLLELPQTWQRGLIAAAVAVPIIMASPAFYAPEWIHTEVDTSLAAYHEAEVAGLQQGTTFTDEYRPRFVFSPPGPQPDLLADYADGYPINKANLPETATARLIMNSAQAHEWRVRAEEPVIMEVFNFYWTGWVAEVNGQRVDISPSPEHGFITFPLPEGVHSVRVYLGLTGARIAGYLVSALTLVGLLVMSALVHGGRSITPPEPLTQTQRWSVVSGGIVAVLVVAIALNEGIAWMNTSPGDSPAQTTVRYTLDDDLQLIGYDLPQTRLSPGETLDLTLYWTTQAQVEVDFSSFVHVSQGGPPLAQADKLHPGGRAISEWWTPEGYIRDAYRIALPETMPPGDYTIYVGLYTCELMPPGDCGNGYRPAVTDAAGEPTETGDSIPLTTITVQE